MKQIFLTVLSTLCKMSILPYVPCNTIAYKQNKLPLLVFLLKILLFLPQLQQMLNLFQLWWRVPQWFFKNNYDSQLSWWVESSSYFMHGLGP